MKISLDWLSDFVEWKEKDPLAIADALTKGTGEVDHVEIQGELLENCCVGKVLAVLKHPNADKLHVCDVETDKGKKRVVCGGTNLKEGMHVAFAHIGARVKWHGEETMTLEPVTIRGEKSEGMICATAELGLETQCPQKPEDGNRPIADLSGKNLKVGSSLKEAFGFNDVIFNIDNHAITNRPDLFSHIGVARECVALGLGKWKKEPTFPAPKAAKDSLPFTMHIDNKDMVYRYYACTLSIDNLGETPDWMKRRLEATGWRSVTLPVDITNYVTMEVGMPLHSFDLDDIEGDVHARLTKKGEKITTLDEKERTLPEGAIVLSDDKGIFDLLGIMGGLRSSTKNSTKNIYLHSAALNPVPIRKTIIGTGHRTDASAIYEKGVAHITAQWGFYRALQLFLELIPGAKMTSAIENWGDDRKPQQINTTLPRITSLIGEKIDDKEAKTILTNLGCDVAVKKDDVIVTPPLWRLKDIQEEADIVEEIARIHGYNKIQPSMPSAQINLPARDDRRDVIRDALKEEGFFELINFTFLSPMLLSKCNLDPKEAVTIENPIGEEVSLMRTSLLPYLLVIAGEERKEAKGMLQCYELGKVFSQKGERDELCLIVAAKSKTALHSEPLLMAKQTIAYALKQAGYAVETSTTKKPANYTHPGRSADIVCQGKTIGSLFEVHPMVQKAFGIPERAAAAAIDWDMLMSCKPEPRTAKALPQFPAISYDETLALTAKQTAAALLNKARNANPLIESVETIDVYENKSERRLTIRFTYRSPEKTLEEDDIAAVHKKVLLSLT